MSSATNLHSDLTFITVRANSADDKLIIFSYVFKTSALLFHANCFPSTTDEL